MNYVLRPRIWPSFRASSGVAPCDVPFRYASGPIPRYRGMVARWHAHLHGLATAIHETSGLEACPPIHRIFNIPYFHACLKARTVSAKYLHSISVHLETRALFVILRSQATKNLTNLDTYASEILRLTPQNDIVGQPPGPHIQRAHVEPLWQRGKLDCL